MSGEFRTFFAVKFTLPLVVKVAAVSCEQEQPQTNEGSSSSFLVSLNLAMALKFTAHKQQKAVKSLATLEQSHSCFLVFFYLFPLCFNDRRRVQLIRVSQELDLCDVSARDAGEKSLGISKTTLALGRTMMRV